MPDIQGVCPSCGSSTRAKTPDSGRDPFCPACGRILPAASAGPQRYFYARGGQKYGPVTLIELQDLVQARQLQPDGMLLPVGTHTWTRIDAIQGFERTAGLGAPALETSTNSDASLRGAHPNSNHSGRATEVRPGDPQAVLPIPCTNASFGKWLLGQVRATGKATRNQTRCMYHYLHCAWSGRRVRQAERTSCIGLGRWLHDNRHGNAQLRSQIDVLQQQIRAAEVVKHSTRSLQASRDTLLCSLAEEGLRREVPLLGAENLLAEARRAVSAASVYKGELRRARAALGSATPTTWARVAITYSMPILIGLCVAVLFLRGTGQTNLREAATWKYWQSLHAIAEKVTHSETQLYGAKSAAEFISRLTKVSVLLRSLSTEISSLPVLNVDAEVIECASQISKICNQKASIYEDGSTLVMNIKALDDTALTPGPYVEAFVRGFFGDPFGVADDLKMQYQKFEKQRQSLGDRLKNLGDKASEFNALQITIRGILAKRYNKEFPILSVVK